MTDASLSPDIALYWNVPLSKELLRFLTRRLNCPEIAADLTQETFLRFQAFVKESPPDNARALAYRIAANLATDYQRKIKVREHIAVEIDPEFLENTSASTTPGPEQIVMARQHLQQFHVALDELSANCRTAFLLHSIDGLTYEEIAVHMGISDSMVFKHLAKAIKHFIKRLDDSE